jgi:hypothetical protein
VASSHQTAPSASMQRTSGLSSHAALLHIKRALSLAHLRLHGWWVSNSSRDQPVDPCTRVQGGATCHAQLGALHLAADICAA